MTIPAVRQPQMDGAATVGTWNAREALEDERRKPLDDLAAMR